MFPEVPWPTRTKVLIIIVALVVVLTVLSVVFEAGAQPLRFLDPAESGLTVFTVGDKLKFRWDPVISPDLAGYRFYYKAGPSGATPYNGDFLPEGPSPIYIPIAALGGVIGHAETEPGIDFLAPWPQSERDEAYWVVVTAYNERGLESGFSNEVGAHMAFVVLPPGGVSVYQVEP
jgi:hypothetical protein